MAKPHSFRLQQFFSVLFPITDGLVEIRPFHPSLGLDRHGRAFLPIGNKAKLAGYCLSLGEQLHVYFGVCTRNKEAKGSRQGTKQYLDRLPALWADLDCKVFGSLPAAQTALKRYPFPPSIIVFTGHGYHAYWVLDEPIRLEDAPRSRLEAALKVLQVDLFGADNVSDLTRILRVPFTYNVKDKNHPVLAEVVSINGKRYHIDTLLEPLPAAKLAAGFSSLPRGIDEARYDNLEAVMKTEFITHCREHAATLPEPLWYAMITNLIGFHGGRKAIHTLSIPHPNYSFEQTEEKIAHALATAPGPHSYHYIAEHGFSSAELVSGELSSPASAAFTRKSA